MASLTFDENIEHGIRVGVLWNADFENSDFGPISVWFLNRKSQMTKISPTRKIESKYEFFGRRVQKLSRTSKRRGGGQFEALRIHMLV